MGNPGNSVMKIRFKNCNGDIVEIPGEMTIDEAVRVYGISEIRFVQPNEPLVNPKEYRNVIDHHLTSSDA